RSGLPDMGTEMLSQAAQAFRNRHGGIVSEIAPRRRQIEPVRRSQLASQKTRHGRLSLPAQYPVNPFEEPSRGVGNTERNRSRHRSDSRGSKDTVHQVPERQRFIVGNEIGLARDRRPRSKAVRG